MKNIFKIHFTTYIFYLILILSGYINYLYTYLIIIIFHELGHIIIIKLLKYNINSIEIYPFGGIIKTNINYNINSNKLFLISISGIFFQILLSLFIKNINIIDYDLYKALNYSIIIFNLLPIYPTDGYKILSSILERFINYKMSLNILNIISYIILFIFFIYTKNIYIFIILYIINIKNIINIKYILNKFKIERYLYKNVYKTVKNVKNEDNLYKNSKNYIKYGNIYLDEEEYFSIKYGVYY